MSAELGESTIYNIPVIRGRSIEAGLGGVNRAIGSASLPHLFSLPVVNVTREDFVNASRAYNSDGVLEYLPSRTSVHNVIFRDGSEVYVIDQRKSIRDNPFEAWHYTKYGIDLRRRQTGILESISDGEIRELIIRPQQEINIISCGLGEFVSGIKSRIGKPVILEQFNI